MAPFFAVEGVIKIDRYAFRAKSPLPPMPLTMLVPCRCVEFLQVDIGKRDRAWISRLLASA
jgi:hypothetical protein